MSGFAIWRFVLAHWATNSLAATAELAELTVLHLDKDFELIAALTGQPQEQLELR